MHLLLHQYALLSAFRITIQIEFELNLLILSIDMHTFTTTDSHRIASRSINYEYHTVAVIRQSKRT